MRLNRHSCLPRLSKGRQDVTAAKRLFRVSDVSLTPIEVVFELNSVSLYGTCLFDVNHLGIDFSNLGCSVSLVSESFDIKFYLDSWLTLSSGLTQVQLDITLSRAITLTGCNCLSVTDDPNINGVFYIEFTCDSHFIDIDWTINAEF